MTVVTRVGSEFLVNTATASDQLEPTITGLADGGFVVSWMTQDPAQDGSGTAIKAQLFNAAGAKVGGEFLVNTVAGGDQWESTITGLADGGFIICWRTEGSLVDDGDAGIKAQLFDASGTKVGSEFLVTATTQYNTQSEPSVTGLTDGGFVISWTTGGAADASVAAVKAQVYDAAGAKAGAEILVNTVTTDDQRVPSLASLTGGGFVASWRVDGFGAPIAGAIRAQVFDAAGAKIGNEVDVFTDALYTQYEPTITGLVNGGFVVSWATFDPAQDGIGTTIKAQIFDAAGTHVGSEVIVNTAAEGDQWEPSITGLADGGFVVSWRTDDSAQDGSDTAIKAQRFSASGVKVGGEFLVNTAAASGQYVPTITGLADGGFVVSWLTVDPAQDGSGYAIKAQIFSVSEDDANQPPAISSDGSGESATINTAENTTTITTVTATDPDAGDTVTYSISGGVDAARFGINSSTGALSFLAAPDYETPADAGGDNVYDVIVSASDGTLEDNQAIAVTVAGVNEAPVFGATGLRVEVAENTRFVTTVTATDPDFGDTLTYTIVGGSDAGLFEIDPDSGGLQFIAAPDRENPADDFADNQYSVLVRASDGNLHRDLGILVRVKDDAESPYVEVTGANTAVSETLSSHIASVDSSVLKDGRVVTVWHILDPAKAPGQHSVKARILGADGQPQGAEFDVATQTTGSQQRPSVTVLADGRFVVAWGTTDPSHDGNEGAIKAQIFSDQGERIGTEFLVNSYAFGNQNIPSLTALADGGFAAVWESVDSDSGESILFSQRFDANGNEAGAETSVRLETSTVDSNPSAVGLAGGGYAILWYADARDTIVARTFSASGVPESASIVLNTDSFSNGGAAIAALDNGGFAIAWGHRATEDSAGPDSVSMQIFSASGAAVSVVIPVNATLSNVGNLDSVSMTLLPDGQLAVAWRGAGDAILARLFDDAGTALSGEFEAVAAPFLPPSQNDRRQSPVILGLNDGNLLVSHVAGTGQGQAVNSLLTTVIDIHLPHITSNGGVDSVALAHAENALAVGDLDADGPAGSSLTYAITGGADAALFNIDSSTGALSFLAAPDFEAPTDADGDNVYEVTVSASDGVLGDTQALAITVTDSAEGVVVDGYVAGAQVFIDVNDNGVLDAGEPVTTSAPDGSFAFATSATGPIRAIGGTNIDTGLPNDLLLSAPAGSTVVSPLTSLVEELVSAGATPAQAVAQVNEAFGLDPALDLTTYDALAAPAGDADALAAQQAAASVAAVLSAVQDAGGDGEAALEALADAASAAATADETVDLDDAGDLAAVLADALPGADPAALAGLTTEVQAQTQAIAAATDLAGIAAVQSNTPPQGAPAAVLAHGQEDVAYIVQAADLLTGFSDADSDPLSVTGLAASQGSLSDNGNGSFTLTLPANFNGPVTLTYAVSDGQGGARAASLGLVIDPVNDAPVITSNGGGASAGIALPENSLAVTTVTATDVDGPALTYSISGGADAALFGINSGTGALSFLAAPDFEAPTDAGGNNVYDVVVRASDGAAQDDQALAITVTDLNQAVTRVGSEFLVNTAAANWQYEPTITGLASGGFVVSWRTDDATQDGSGSAIKAQLFNAAGIKLGDEFLVNTAAANWQYEPTITGLADGGFVVSWRTVDSAQDGSDTAIKAQLFSAVGAKVGGEVLVNTAAANSQVTPTITGLTDGGFVVSWYTYDPAQDGSATAIKAQLFSGSGAKVGSEVLVNTAAAINQAAPTITSLADGGFVVSWWTDDATQDGSGSAIKAQLFEAAGVKVGGEVLVNTAATNWQYEPTITGLAGGGFVVSWRTEDATQDGSGTAIKAQLFDVAGEKVGGELLVNTAAASHQFTPTITGLADGGFVVSWTTQDSTQDGSGNAIKAQLFSATGAKVGGEFLVNTLAGGHQWEPTITGLADGGFVVSWWTQDPTQDGSSSAIKAQIFEINRPTIISNGAGDVGSVSASEAVLAVQTLAATDPRGNPVTWSLAGGADAGQFTINAATGSLRFLSAPDLDTPSDSDGNNIYEVVVRANNGVLTDDQTLNVHVVRQLDHSSVSRISGEVRVNSASQGDQYQSAASRLQTGGFVAVWTDASRQGGDLSAPGIKAQRYDADGAPVGEEVSVNARTLGAQNEPSVAGLSGGAFIVTWRTADTAQDGSSDAVMARLFNADGEASSDEFVINTTTTNSQQLPSVAALSDGRFVVTWTDWSGIVEAASSGVRAQIFSATGVKEGAELLVNSVTDGHQEYSVVSGLATGGFIIVWQDPSGQGGDADGHAIKAQVYDAGGAKAGSEILVNSQTVGSQAVPSVGTLADGNVVITWHDSGGIGADSSGLGIKAQILSPTGEKVGGEIGVNSHTVGNQAFPSVATLANGAFVISWQTDDENQDGGSYAVKAQAFDASGQRMGQEFLVNTFSANQQYEPSIVAVADGKVAITWTTLDQAQDGTNSAVKVQLFNVGVLPLITSGGGGESAALAVTENSTAVSTVTATDAQNEPLTYSIAGGADAARFAIDAATGALRFIAAPDYEAPTDAGGDNVYDVIVRASDGALFDEQALAITVTNAFEHPNVSHVGAEVRLNAAGTGNQSEIALAALGGGAGHVAVWTSDDAAQDGSGSAIKGRIVTAAGVAQAEFLVNSAGAASQSDPAVGVLGGGGFVVAWRSDDAGRDGNLSAIVARQFDASGAPAGADFVVNSAGVNFQTLPTVTGLSGGGYLISWTTDDAAQDGSSNAVRAQLFDAAGARVGSEFALNTQAASFQYESTVTALSGGGFMAAWQSGDAAQDGSDSAIKAQVFDAAGVKVGGEFRINELATANQMQPALAALQGGAVVAIWRSDDAAQDGSVSAIKGRLFSSAGAPLGAEFLINSQAANGQYTPMVAATANGGFVVSWHTLDSAQDGSGTAVKAQAFNAAGIKLGDEFLVNTAAVGDQNQAAIAALANGDFVIGWTTGDTAQDGSGSAVKAQVFSVDQAPVITSNGGGATASVSVAENGAAVTTVTATDPDAGDTVAWSISGGADAALFGIDAATGALSFLTAPDYEAPADAGSDNVYDVIVSATDGTLTDTQALAVTVTDRIEGYVRTAGTEFLVNTAGANTQWEPAITGLADGGFVVSWYTNDSAQDGSGTAIKAQLFSATGEKVGTEFLVNTAGANNQWEPTITGLAGGGFVVSWITADATQDGSGTAIKAQLFNAAGVKVGSEVLVNTAAASDQLQPTITGLVGGGFVVSWLTADGAQDGSGYAIKAQLFSASGVKVGGEALVNTATVNSQYEPTITGLADGGFVVSWWTADPTQDGSGSAIKAQLFNAAGIKLGDELLVNTAAANWQIEPTITGLADGGFVVSWRTADGAQDGSGSAIKAQVFNASGVKAGGELLVNTATAGDQTEPTITGLADGGFVVSWWTDDGAQDGSGSAIKAQLFNAAGVQVGGEVLVNTAAANWQYEPTITGLAGGGFVVSWRTDDATQDGSGTAIKARVFRFGPDIDSMGGGDTAAVSVAEGPQAVGAVHAIQPEDSAPIVYSIAGGADAGQFTIDAATGALAFSAAPDFEAPTDAGSDNIYDVTVRATASLGHTDQSIAVTVTDVVENSPPVIAGGDTAAFSIAENGTAVTTVSAADPDAGDAVTYSLAGGADSALFSIDSSTGALSFLAAPNFEAPADTGIDNVYDVVVRASDTGGLFDDQSVAVTVTNVNEAPTAAATNSVTTDEDVASASIAIGAADVDAGTVLTYSVKAGAAPAKGAVAFAGGAFTYTPTLDANGSDTFTIVVSDGTLTTEQVVSVTINPVNDAPVITSNGGDATAAVSVAENTLAVTKVAATDVDGPSVSYGLAGGADAALFSIDSSTGALSFLAAPDADAPGDAGGDNVYDVIVSATDGTLTDTQALAVTVTNSIEGYVRTAGTEFLVNTATANNQTTPTCCLTEVCYRASTVMRRAISPPAAAGGDIAALSIHSPPRMSCPVISARHAFTAFCTRRSFFFVKRDGSALISRCKISAAGIAGSASNQARI